MFLCIQQFLLIGMCHVSEWNSDKVCCHDTRVAPPLPRSLFLGRCSSTPPVPRGRRRRRGRGHVKNGALPHGRADIVQVYAQHDQYGVEGKAETEGPDAGAAQEEAEPVDQPAGGDRESLVPV